MASYLPFRLTKLYSNTKQDIVAEQAKLENVPELNSLHRKFRIQKDRLITWGLEWSDDSTATSQGNIDESIARAGLTETVTSVLGTIQDILDEADRISRSVDSDLGDTKSGTSWAKSPNKRSWTPADKARYENLAEELTTCIDTLHDISRSRRAISQGTYPFGIEEPSTVSVSKSSTSDTAPFPGGDSNDSALTLINPTTIPRTATDAESPQKIDPSSLILPEEEPPPYETIGVPSCTRLIGHLRRMESSTNPWKASRSADYLTPVLIEYAGFDPAYQLTGVPIPLHRLERLVEILSHGVGRFGDGPDAPGFGTLKCLGYFEDLRQPRYGFVFELPSFVYQGLSESLRPSEVEVLRPATLLSIIQTGSKSFAAHNSTVASIPPLEQRFRIALNLALSFSKLHASGFVHKDVNSSNILVFRKPQTTSHHSHRQPEYELRSPYLCSFDLFSEFNLEPISPGGIPLNIYRHPHDPRASGRGNAYTPNFDIYSLGLILLEIGHWFPLADIFKAKYTLSHFKKRLEEIWVKKLAGKCGTAYMHAVWECVTAVDKDLPESELRSVYDRVLGRLHKCCQLDEEDPHEIGSGDVSTPRRSMGFSKRHMQTTDDDTSLPVPKPKKRYSPGIMGYFSEEGLKRRSVSSPSGLGTEGVPEDIPHIKESPLLGMWDRAFRQNLPEGHRQITKTVSPSIPKESEVNAANTIQRAWRAHLDRLSFREYRRKVMLIQNHWRQRKTRRASIPTGTPRPSLQRSAEDSYPTPESNIAINEMHIQTLVKMKQHSPRPKRKLLIQPLWQPTPEIITEWDQTLLPRLMRICERALKDSTESSSIDLFGIGVSPTDAKATIVVTCSSVAKVKAAIARRFSYDRAVYDLKVHRGKIKRSKLTRPNRRVKPPHRSMMDSGECEDGVPPLNRFFQQRPVCGASIGAYKGEHLPPVSYGGVVLVDGEPYGMSVHHMLDVPSEDESEYDEDISDVGSEDVVRSSAHLSRYPWTSSVGAQPLLQDLPDVPRAFEISDDEELDDEGSDYFYDSTSELSSDDDESVIAASEAGDVPGVEVGYGDEITITQPAIDDVDDDFFPCEEDKEEDHLDSHELGHVYASSGIRRWNRNGVVHEIDWSLLKLKDDRLQPYNLIQGGKRFCAKGKLCPKLVDPVSRQFYGPEEDEYPSQVAKAEDLGSLRVHCFGRTSGLKGGVISHTMTAVKVHGRKSYARSWNVSGGLGVGGDSGAWVIDNEQGRVCGHVLAWCDRNHVAYICPMEVLLEDIKRTLDARKVMLPGSEEEVGEKIGNEKEKSGFGIPDITALSIDDVQVADEVKTRFMIDKTTRFGVCRRGTTGPMA